MGAFLMGRVSRWKHVHRPRTTSGSSRRTRVRWSWVSMAGLTAMPVSTLHGLQHARALQRHSCCRPDGGGISGNLHVVSAGLLEHGREAAPGRGHLRPDRRTGLSGREGWQRTVEEWWLQRAASAEKYSAQQERALKEAFATEPGTSRRPTRWGRSSVCGVGKDTRTIGQRRSAPWIGTHLHPVESLPHRDLHPYGHVPGLDGPACRSPLHFHEGVVSGS